MTPLPFVDPIAQAVIAPAVPLDLGKVVLTVLGVILSGLATAVIFFVKRLIASFDGFKTEITAKVDRVGTELTSHSTHVDGQLRSISQQVQTVTHEMFGPNGDNGMRGDLRRTKELVVKHDRLLVRLADRADISFEED